MEKCYLSEYVQSCLILQHLLHSHLLNIVRFSFSGYESLLKHQETQTSAHCIYQQLFVRENNTFVQRMELIDFVIITD